MFRFWKYYKISHLGKDYVQCIQWTAGVHRSPYVLTQSEYALFKLSNDDAYREPKDGIFMHEIQIGSLLRRGRKVSEFAGMAGKTDSQWEQSFSFPESLCVLGRLQISAA